jgi:hypothetical protein
MMLVLHETAEKAAVLLLAIGLRSFLLLGASVACVF